MSVKYRLYQNNNPRSQQYKKWYGRAVATDTVDTRQLADIIEANCTVKHADIMAVLAELAVTMKRELQDSKRVKIDNVGTFKIGISTTPSDTAADFTVAGNVKGVHMLFQPELRISSVGGNRTRSRAFLDGCQVAELPKNLVADEVQEPDGGDTPVGN